MVERSLREPENTLMCLALVRMTKESLSALQAVQPIVIQCGKLALTCCRNIADKVLPRRLQVDLLSKFFGAVRFRFTVPRGVT